MSLDIKEEEKYTFGDITFIGNTVYSDEFLKRKLRIEKGDTYNGIELQKDLADASSQMQMTLQTYIKIMDTCSQQ